MTSKKISHAVIKRLPRYYRHLELLENQGVAKVSSGKLAEILDITASQVRQDFCNFGGFGQQGYGYDVSNLKQELSKIMGLDKMYNCIIIGGGNMGRAVAGYKGFRKEGFYINAIFDVKIDSSVNYPVNIYNMSALADYVKNNKTDVAIITTKMEVANEVAKQVVELGIKNIWNFAPTDLNLPEDIVVENISMSESLYVLAYHINNKE